ncbi:M24 family metallopeptidase [Kangiella taiwanensis]|uniref:Metallopeptidase MdpA n=1 Tax=Kangiella taiwanensis TaxID=1079179 RepID=A0ABP8HQ75_9GAMM|nr:Xaa-Pro peptidase family protein [Kangiella taiwanensis]
MTTRGIGGKTPQKALSALSNMMQDIEPISAAEHQQRIDKAQSLMRRHNIDAIYLNAGTNLTYFTGLRWYPSERLVGAILPATGKIQYIAPDFEVGSLNGYMMLEGPMHTWLEHECPYKLTAQVLNKLGYGYNATIGIDESTAFFIADGFKQAAPHINFFSAKAITAGCRMQKSEAETALIQRAMDMTLEVHKAAASILREGISTAEVVEFIEQAHRKVGASGSYFCIVLFGEATSYPHGVKHEQYLKPGDMVLIDTGCKAHGYLSDITRTYVYGESTEKQQQVWQHEKNAQLAAFKEAQLGTPCEKVDQAARSYLVEQGYGPEYQLPGLPHRTGHGIGLDIHEWPYLVGGDKTPLDIGMCFSNEPMLVIPNEFGIRLEDHFYMTSQGPKWFTQPSESIENPFNLPV